MLSENKSSSSDSAEEDGNDTKKRYRKGIKQTCSSSASSYNNMNITKLNTLYPKRSDDSKKEMMLERLQYYFKQNKFSKTMANQLKIKTMQMIL